MKKPKPTPQEIAEESKKIRTLRFMVDFSMSLISQGRMTREEAIEQFEKVKRVALRLFPDKEEAFEIIYAPRFIRIINEIYGLH
jgi:hypothetical protein